MQSEGFETELSVGRSQYRIDVGVVDPENPDAYLLGIMLDGSNYGAARTTRDREIAQLNVLSGLGWSILRIWCMDWWDNPKKEIGRILSRLGEIRSGKNTSVPKTETSVPKVQAVRLRGIQAAPEQAKSPPVYAAAVLRNELLPADLFAEPRHIRDIQRKTEWVIDSEAPVSQTTLIRRVVQSYGIARAGSRIQAHMGMILRRVRPQATQQEKSVFYWKAGQSPDHYAGFRVNGEGENFRDVRDIPVQEVANAVYVVLYEQVSMAKEDLLRETARKLGYTRLGGNVLSVLAMGLQYAERLGCIALGANGACILTDDGTKRAEMTLKSF